MWRAHRQGRLVSINHGAAGIGDALQGLLAVAGLKADKPDAFIQYKVGHAAVPFVRLFSGYDHLNEHRYEAGADCPPSGDTIQLNKGHGRECESRCKIPRWQRYMDNAGVKSLVTPSVIDPERLERLGRPYRGSVLLSPFSTDSRREWPIQSWLTLEMLLRKSGYRVIAIHNDMQRTMRFREKRGGDAETVAAMISAAELFIGNDSGMAHLSGILGQRTIVLVGPTSGQNIFGCYKSVHCLEGKLICNGCWLHGVYYDAKQCNTCPSLATITPEEVFRTTQLK